MAYGHPNYARLKEKAVYDGIDLVFHSRGGQLEYDFEVAAGPAAPITPNVGGATAAPGGGIRVVPRQLTTQVPAFGAA